MENGAFAVGPSRHLRIFPLPGSSYALYPLRAYNFSAGPASLPEEVLLELRDELPTYPGLGAALFEVSHRSKPYAAVHDSAVDALRRLLGLEEDWHVLFLTGGASMQFYQVPLNLLGSGQTAAYVNTGVWATKAIAEAQKVASVRGAELRVAASSESTGFDRIPDPALWDMPRGAAYLHFTSNNTIYGTELLDDVHAGSIPVVCDASSDFLSRPLDTTCYSMLYAGAQKNLGPAGVALVLLRDDLLRNRPASLQTGLPAMLDYASHTGALYNTPPALSVYLTEKVLRWIERQGGLAEMDRRAAARAGLLYERIDRTDFYRGTAAPAWRSRMNVTFRLPSEELEAAFLKESERRGMIGLKGYRTVGGIRASLYNAMPQEGVEALVALMDDFEARMG
ncbi:MAG: 3-phosphoserine/phosphohydroxythreonine transaminase [Rhodothermales bacterium]|nr:3-phosphoserine/phosphohydroxythreonine transaminase [Rhodothermales bacterium]